MIRLGMVWALARAEARLTRRLVRFWVFQVVAFLLGVVAFAWYGGLHWWVSHWSATAALISPRYLATFLGMYYIVIFLIGLIFLGYDVRARDTRERMVEVLDALPVSNLELLFGRFLGIMIPAWIPVVVTAGFLALIGLPFGESIELRSLITFALPMAIPAYVLVLGTTFFLTLLLRNRLLAAIVLIGMIVGLIVINFNFVSVMWLPMVDLTGAFSVMPPSDIIPSVIDWRGMLQRTGLMVFGLGMLCLAAAIHPRRDDTSRTLTAAIGGVMLLVGLLLPYILVAETKSLLNRKAEWKAIHEARADDPTPDLIELAGVVSIRPGNGIEMQLDLRFAAREGESLSTALFTLNPGLDVASVTGEGGELSFTHADGLLEVELGRTLPAGEQMTIRTTIGGTPDEFFAYLDAVMDPFTANIKEGNVFMLGAFPMIDDRRFVALLPGVRWLPAPGSEMGRGDPRRHPHDFFELKLEVELPSGWTVAGPGRRRELPAQGDRSRFAFAPPAPVPDVALIAGRMESRSVEVGGVTLEVMVHPAHTGNLDFLEDAGGEIHTWLEERMNEATEIGLPYPYDGLTLVEVPGSLRGYGGGWRMDSTMIQPAMILTREAGFPTARFDVPFRDPDKFKDHDGGVPRVKREHLERFFETDFSGGNPFVAAARSFFAYQTSSSGPDGMTLDYVWEDLVTRLITDKQGYFSVHHYGADLNQTMGNVMGAIFSSDSDNMAEVIIRSITARNDVWDAVLGVSLADLDPWEEPKRALDVLTLKGGGMARSLLDDLGPVKSGELLAAIRRDHTGNTYTREDVIAAGEEIGEDLEAWMDVWIRQTDLPGFTVGEVRAHRLKDSDEGSPRYQILAVLRNEEPTAGLLKLVYRTGGTGRDAKREETEPIRVPAASSVEIGIVSAEPPRRLLAEPYLALNRESFAIALPPIDEERIVDEEPFSGARPFEWTPTDDGSIIVDDLDAGFTVEGSDKKALLRVAGQGVTDEQTDQGLPVAQFGRPPSKWSRRSSASAYGKYRHTTALVRGGKGDRRAVFATELPKSGPWELEYHLPPRRGSGKRSSRGTWKMTLEDTSGTHPITFDADGAEAGWNSLGTFELAAGDVRFAVSDETDGRIVLADAVRFRPAGAGSGGGGGAAKPGGGSSD